MALVVLGCVLVASDTGRTQGRKNGINAFVRTFNGQGTVVTDWSDTGNWNPPGVPGSEADEIIVIGGSFAVTHAATFAPETILELQHTSTQPLTFTGGDLTVTSTAAIGSGGLTLTGGAIKPQGTLTINGGVHFTAGSIQPAGTVTISGPVDWDGGTVASTGSIVLNGGIDLTTGANKTINGPTVTLPNGQMATWSSTGPIRFGSGGAFVNNGTFDVQTDADIVDIGGGGSFTNAGTFMKSAGTTTPTTVAVPFTTTGGTVDIQVGTLELSSTMSQSGGDVTGAGTVTVAGTYNWTDGTQSGAGITNLNGGLTLGGGGNKVLSGRTLNSPGTTTVTGTGSLFINNGVFNNNGTYDLQTDASIGNLGGSPTFNNVGTLTKSGGGAISQIGVAFNNTGTVNAASGTLDLAGGGSCGGACNGAFNVTAKLRFSANTFELGGGAMVAGSGTVEFGNVNHAGTHNVTGATTVTSGTTNFTGTVMSVGTLSLSGSGTANFSSGDTITPTGTVTQSGGLLTGSDTLTVMGMYDWTGGTQLGTGITNLNGGLTQSGAGNNQVGRTVNSSGPVVVTGAGSLGIGSGGVFNNNGTYDLQTNAGIFNFGGAATFNNSGSFTKSGGTASTISVDFNNSGTVSVASGGTLSFIGTFGQTAGSTRTCITTAPFSGLNLLGGSFFGVPPGPCTITGDINNTGGTVVTGDGMGLPVVITLNSTYTQGAGGAFTVPIGGTTPGGTANNFGQLNISGMGDVVLAGTMNVTLVNGFMPQPGNTFNVLTYGSRTGAFGNVNLPPIAPNVWHVGQGPTSVVLSVAAGGDPFINSNGSVNAASFAPGGAVAPGGIAAIFGSNLATSVATAAAIPLPTTLGGATMVFNNNQSVPKFFAASTQINIQIPWELQGASSANLTDTVNNISSPVEPVSLAMFSPGLFATNQQGFGQGAVLIANTTVFAAPPGSIPGSTSRAAVRGIDFLEIYCTGLGAVTNQPATGDAAVANPLSETTTTPQVTIGGAPTTVLFSGLAPGFVGLYVVTLQVPAGAPVGGAVPVVLTIGGIPSNTVTIAVE